MNLNNQEDENSIFSENLELFEKLHPGFQRILADKYKASEELILSEASDGLLTARIDNVWLHSSRAPKREAQKLVKSGIRKSGGICVVFGFGLGYHIEALLDEYPDIRLLIVEPEPELLLRVMQKRDLSSAVKRGRIDMLFDSPPEIITSILAQYGTDDIQVLRLRPLFERNKDYYEKADAEIASFIRKKETNMNTLTRFGRTWIKNLFRNIEVFRTAGDSGRWYGQFSDIPVLVIAAGPSLDGLLPILPKLQKRMLVVCVDTALKAVLGSGAVPDFVTVVDPQYLNTRHLDNLLNRSILRNKTALISESSTHPAVFRHCGIPVFFYSSIFPLGKMLEQTTEIRSELGAGGSVSTTAWDFARRLGSGAVYTAGLDLGYPQQQTHCKTSLSAIYTQLGAKRLKTAETISFSGVHNADPHFEPNNADGLTMTDKRLIIYKWWFEGQLKNYSGQNRFFNLSRYGVKIDGMELGDAEALLELPERREEISNLKANILSQAHSKPDSTMDDISNVLNMIITECLRLEEICNKAISILESAELPESIRQLSSLDQKISQSPSKELTGFIIQPVLNEIISGDKSAQENSELLYTNLLDACQYHRIHAERAMARLNIAKP